MTTVEKISEPEKVSAGTTRIGEVALRVRRIDEVAAFYRDAVGLAELERREGEVGLGVGDATLLRLVHDPAAQPGRPGAAGLFHVAFLLPDRAALGRWLHHAAAAGIPLDGASDHIVSEAVYLADPEGNGVEIYVDRPRDEWQWTGGMVRMATRQLDLPSLMDKADGPWRGAPAGTTVGHIHLKVGASDEAEAFYGGLLGMDVVSRYPGASFMSRQGYHHHVAANVWQSQGAGRREPGRLGLDRYELLLDPAGYDAAVARLGEAGLSSGGAGTEAELEDPWGNRIRLRRAA